MAELGYEVSIKGAASPTLRAAFPDCVLDTHTGLTVVLCPRRALPDVIERIEDLGLRLLYIRLVVKHPDVHRSPPA